MYLTRLTALAYACSFLQETNASRHFRKDPFPVSNRHSKKSWIAGTFDSLLHGSGKEEKRAAQGICIKDDVYSILSSYSWGLSLCGGYLHIPDATVTATSTLPLSTFINIEGTTRIAVNHVVPITTTVTATEKIPNALVRGRHAAAVATPASVDKRFADVAGMLHAVVTGPDVDSSLSSACSCLNPPPTSTSTVTELVAGPVKTQDAFDQQFYTVDITQYRTVTVTTVVRGNATTGGVSSTAGAGTGLPVSLTTLQGSQPTAPPVVCPQMNNSHHEQIINGYLYSYAIFCDTQYIDSDISGGQFSAASAEQCSAHCSNGEYVFNTTNPSHCTSWTWDSATKQCYLKNKPSQFTYVPGAVSGRIAGVYNISNDEPAPTGTDITRAPAPAVTSPPGDCNFTAGYSTSTRIEYTDSAGGIAWYESYTSNASCTVSWWSTLTSTFVTSEVFTTSAELTYDATSVTGWYNGTSSSGSSVAAATFTISGVTTVYSSGTLTWIFENNRTQFIHEGAASSGYIPPSVGASPTTPPTVPATITSVYTSATETVISGNTVLTQATGGFSSGYIPPRPSVNSNSSLPIGNLSTIYVTSSVVITATTDVPFPTSSVDSNGTTNGTTASDTRSRSVTIPFGSRTPNPWDDISTSGYAEITNVSSIPLATGPISSINFNLSSSTRFSPEETGTVSVPISFNSTGLPSSIPSGTGTSSLINSVNSTGFLPSSIPLVTGTASISASINSTGIPSISAPLTTGTGSLPSPSNFSSIPSVPEQSVSSIPVPWSNSTLVPSGTGPFVSLPSGTGTFPTPSTNSSSFNISSTPVPLTTSYVPASSGFPTQSFNISTSASGFPIPSVNISSSVSGFPSSSLNTSIPYPSYTPPPFPNATSSSLCPCLSAAATCVPSSISVITVTNTVTVSISGLGLTSSAGASSAPGLSTTSSSFLGLSPTTSRGLITSSARVTPPQISVSPRRPGELATPEQIAVACVGPANGNHVLNGGFEELDKSWVVQSTRDAISFKFDMTISQHTPGGLYDGSVVSNHSGAEIELVQALTFCPNRTYTLTFYDKQSSDLSQCSIAAYIGGSLVAVDQPGTSFEIAGGPYLSGTTVEQVSADLVMRISCNGSTVSPESPGIFALDDVCVEEGLAFDGLQKTH